MERSPTKKKFKDVLIPISLGESGKGLPYAPIDWPNPGDIWGWKVGKRIKKRTGFYQDRYLIAPQSFRENPSKQILLDSKPSIERFCRSILPEFDVDAFFASFVWDIPAEGASTKKGKFASSSNSFPALKEERANGIYKRTRRSRRGQKIKESIDEIFIDLTFDQSSEDEETLSNDTAINNFGSSNFKDDEVSNAAGFPNGGVFGSTSRKFESLEPLDQTGAAMNVEVFDNYIDGLEDVLNMPLLGNQSRREEVMGARKELSALLAMGFPSLIASNKLTELAGCVSKLQNDPSISPQEASMIKLIQEIPLSRKHFLDAKEASEEAEKSFADLDSNIAIAASLKQEYNKSKKEIEILQAKAAAASLEMAEIDNQIADLQSYHLSLTENVKATREKIAECTATQRRVMDQLPKVVQEVQAANSKKAEWGLRKKRSEDQEAEILAKFAPLERFSF